MGQEESYEGKLAWKQEKNNQDWPELGFEEGKKEDETWMWKNTKGELGERKMQCKRGKNRTDLSLDFTKVKLTISALVRKWQLLDTSAKSEGMRKIRRKTEGLVERKNVMRKRSDKTKNRRTKSEGTWKRRKTEVKRLRRECRGVKVTEEKRELKVWRIGRRKRVKKRWRKIVGRVFGRNAKKVRRRVSVGRILTFLLLGVSPQSRWICRFGTSLDRK